MADIAEARRLRAAGLRYEDLADGLQLTRWQLWRLHLSDLAHRLRRPFAALATRFRRVELRHSTEPPLAMLACPYCAAEAGARHAVSCPAI